jgi:uncharacterized protein (TIGR02680 family)
MDPAPDFGEQGPKSTPELPAPTRTRWQPLRIGLVELFHYDSEEFWFRDGHLLLRGNNGTGKSKVLSLTLPFLLDASLSASRVEPDGDRSKRMEWNLLMGRYERRIGYSWVEFGRRDEEGAARYLTLGCGMQAVAGRPRVDAWHFWTDQRVGPELALISSEGVVLSRERLEAALEGRGHLCRTATEYRQEVDRLLFHLGDDRYGALIETLIQLRQPQLSKKPDEQSLSDALTHALPELPRSVLEDVAEALNQLDEYRDELAQIERVHGTVTEFGRRYQAYAQIQARRQARLLRQAQTEFDNQSRGLSEARAELSAASAQVEQQDARVLELDRQLVRDRAALEELQADPAMQDTRRLGDLAQALKSAERELERAEQEANHHRQRLAAETAELERSQRELDSATKQESAEAGELHQCAAQAGVEGEERPLADQLLGLRDVDEHLRELGRRLGSIAHRRESQIGRIREQLGRCAKLEAERDAAEARCLERRSQLESAEARVREADESLARSGAELVEAWRAHLGRLRVLVINAAEVESGLAELEDWVRSLAFEHPLRRPLDSARERAQLELAHERSELSAAERRLDSEDAELAREERELQGGKQLEPLPLPTRDPLARRDRPGAPFWQLLEFREHVTAEQRAGLEAALEASGLLDAWVTPEAVVLAEATNDAWLTPGPPQAGSLLDWLVPGDEAEVELERLQRLLASIAVADADLPSADSWLSLRGEFRIGRLAGAHRKNEAQFLGRAAREAARRARLAIVAARRAELVLERQAIDGARAALDERQGQLAEEVADAPRDEELQRAHTRYATLVNVRADAHTELARAEAEREAVQERLRQARSALEQDARDLKLPASADALSEVERGVTLYQRILPQLLGTVERRARSGAAHERQRERLERTAAEAQASDERHEERRREHDDARTRHDLLRETAGAAIAELEARLAAARQRVSSGTHRLTEERGALTNAREQRARFDQRVQDCQLQLDERVARRQTCVERLHGFHQTGLLAVATPDLEPPHKESWTVDPTLNLSRRIEAALERVPAEDHDWTRAQNDISRDYTALGQSLSALGERAEMEQTDFGMVVQIVYGNRSERPDRLSDRLGAEIEERRGILSAREREVLENHLQSEVAAYLQRHLREAEERLQRINTELERRPTSTGVYFKLEWEPLPEGDDGAPVGLATARTRLLRRTHEAWSVDDRRAVGEFLRARIASERANDESGPLIEHLARALDYRRWHRFRVKRWHDGAFRALSGPASSGERALGLTVPLFAAASSHYQSSDFPHAPRLVLLDEAFAGIDDEARAHCMALIHEFDLDFVMTSEREWGCYATLPGVSICQVIRREGIDAVYVSRWTWDGRERREVPDPRSGALENELT